MTFEKIFAGIWEWWWNGRQILIWLNQTELHFTTEQSIIKTRNTHSIHTQDLRPPLLIGLWQWMKDVCHLFPISHKMCPPCCHSNFLVGGYDHKAFGVEHCLSHFLWNSITKLSKFAAFLFVRLSLRFRTRVFHITPFFELSLVLLTTHAIGLYEVTQKISVL